MSAVEPLVGASGWLQASKLTVRSLEEEEFLLLTGVTAEGETGVFFSLQGRMRLL